MKLALTLLLFLNIKAYAGECGVKHLEAKKASFSQSIALGELKSSAARLESDIYNKGLRVEVEKEIFNLSKRYLEAKSISYKVLDGKNILIQPTEVSEIGRFAQKIKNEHGQQVRLIFSPSLLLNDFHSISAHKNPILAKDFYISTLELIEDSVSQNLKNQFKEYGHWRKSRLSALSEEQKKIANYYRLHFSLHNKFVNLSNKEKLYTEFFDLIESFIKAKNIDYKKVNNQLIIPSKIVGEHDSVIDPKVMLDNHHNYYKWSAALYKRSMDEGRVFHTLEAILQEDFPLRTTLNVTENFNQTKYLLHKQAALEHAARRAEFPEIEFGSVYSQSYLDRIESGKEFIYQNFFSYMNKGMTINASLSEPMVMNVDLFKAASLYKENPGLRRNELSLDGGITSLVSKSANPLDEKNIYPMFSSLIYKFPGNTYHLNYNDKNLFLIDFARESSFLRENEKLHDLRETYYESYLDFLSKSYKKRIGVSDEDFSELKKITNEAKGRSCLFLNLKKSQSGASAKSIADGAIAVISHNKSEKLPLEVMNNMKLPRDLDEHGNELPIIEIGRHARSVKSDELLNIVKFIATYNHKQVPRPSKIYIQADKVRGRLFSRYGFKPLDQFNKLDVSYRGEENYQVLAVDYYEFLSKQALMDRMN